MFLLDAEKGVLHRKQCGLQTVNAGNQKHYNNCENARKDELFKECHIAEGCMGIDEC